jgi:hypothetical protein
MRKIVLLCFISTFLSCSVCSQHKSNINSRIKLEAYFERDSVLLNDSCFVNITLSNISNLIINLDVNPVCYLARIGNENLIDDYAKPFYSINNPEQHIYNSAFFNSQKLEPNQKYTYKLQIKIDDFFFKENNKIQLILLYPKSSELFGVIRSEVINIYVK